VFIPQEIELVFNLYDKSYQNSDEYENYQKV